MCYDDSTQNIRNLYCFKDLYIGIIVLVVKRRGFFGHVFCFGFNGQRRKQIEQKGGDRAGRLHREPQRAAHLKQKVTQKIKRLCRAPI